MSSARATRSPGPPSGAGDRMGHPVTRSATNGHCLVTTTWPEKLNQFPSVPGLDHVRPVASFGASIPLHDWVDLGKLTPTTHRIPILTHAIIEEQPADFGKNPTTPLLAAAGAEPDRMRTLSVQCGTYPFPDYAPLIPTDPTKPGTITIDVAAQRGTPLH